MTTNDLDCNLINDPVIAAASIEMATRACQNVRQGVILLRAASATIAMMAVHAEGETPEVALNEVVDELADNARTILARMLKCAEKHEAL